MANRARYYEVNFTGIGWKRLFGWITIFSNGLAQCCEANGKYMVPAGYWRLADEES